MDISSARAYFETLKKNEGIIVKQLALDRVIKEDNSLKAANNKKHAVFSKAYESETQQSTFVEVPIIYDQKLSMVITDPNATKQCTTFEKMIIFRFSFDRLLIYKNKTTGVINDLFITYIPDIVYLQKHKYNIIKNQINKLDNDFSGFIEFKKWDGTRLYALQYKDGKKVRYFSLRQKTNPSSINNTGKKSTNKVGVNAITCDTYPLEMWGESCIGAGPEGDTECLPYLIGYTYVQICTDGGLGGDPCLDFGVCDPVDPCLVYGNCPVGVSYDCAGVPSGSAHMESCGCIGGTTGISNCSPSDLIDSLSHFPCASSILAELPILKNDIARLLNKTFNGSCDQHITFVAATFPTGPNGETTDGDCTTVSIEPKNGINWDAGVIFNARIRINEDVLNHATKEYILATMYHEALHAYLSTEKIRLRASFPLVYPDVNIAFINLGHAHLNRNQNVFVNSHATMALTFFDGLKSAISDYNPNLSNSTVSALASSGIYTSTPTEQNLNSRERDVRNGGYTGTKCP